MISNDYSPGRRSLRLMLSALALLALAVPAWAFGPPPSEVYRQHAVKTPREVSDQEHAKYQRQSGKNLSFEELYGRASAVGRGEYLGVEPDISRNIYRFKFMRAGGNVVWVDMDGRTGKVIAARQ